MHILNKFQQAFKAPILAWVKINILNKAKA